VAGLCLSAISALAADIPGSAAVNGPLGFSGGTLKGEYWKRPVNTIFTDGVGVPAHRIDVQINGFGPPTGTFVASNFVYLGNDLTAVRTWLGADSVTYSGVNSNLDDGAFRLKGFVNVTAPGTINLGTTSDDGARITIAGIDISNGDNGHGDETHDGDANFEAAGLYPIEITYFNGDWTSDGNNHSLNPDPGVHGGANFHLRVAGADVTPARAGIFHPVAPPRLVSTTLVAPANTPWAYNDTTLAGTSLHGTGWE